MTQHDFRNAWIEAGKRLATDAQALVRCPVCGKANLVVRDVPIENYEKFERIMQCPNCESRNILLMTTKQ
jgi:Zn finger protein HypA/HybF involved in hydrogenase expression